MLTVYYGAYFSKAIAISQPVLFAMFSAACIAGAGYAMNDVFDFHIDKINKPNRILPQEKITLKSAYHYALFLFVLGVTLSFFTGKIANVGIAVFNSILLFYYAKIYKMKFISGNIIVSFTSASTFLYGGITNKNVKNALLVAVFAFLYTFAREIVKDLEDKPADEQYQASTMPIKLGISATVIVLFFMALCILLYSVWLLGKEYFSLNTFAMFILFVNIPLFMMILYIKKKPQVPVFKRVSNWMKADMLVLLIILAIG
jgi:geranylgeranylglycerol-phosphate geranylgeranyltransferase